MKAPRVGFILYCIPNAACMEVDDNLFTTKHFYVFFIRNAFFHFQIPDLSANHIIQYYCITTIFLLNFSSQFLGHKDTILIREF